MIGAKDHLGSKSQIMWFILSLVTWENNNHHVMLLWASLVQIVKQAIPIIHDKITLSPKP
jgi:hypothetical protein